MEAPPQGISYLIGQEQPRLASSPQGARQPVPFGL